MGGFVFGDILGSKVWYTFSMKSYLQKGFTLIELLVVIAIIGILAAVVLASLSTARSKGSDTKVKAQLLSVRNAAETYYGISNTYTASTMASPALPCTGTMFVHSTTLLAITGTASAWPTGTLLSCQATTGSWAVSSNLPLGGYWCVDSIGISKSEGSNLASGVVACP